MCAAAVSTVDVLLIEVAATATAECCSVSYCSYHNLIKQLLSIAVASLNFVANGENLEIWKYVNLLGLLSGAHKNANKRASNNLKSNFMIRASRGNPLINRQQGKCK